MGFFNRKPTYPELSADSPAAQQIRAIEGSLKELIGQISDPLEIVPAHGHAFVFIGKPPKRFGMAMLDNEVHSFIAAAQEHGLDQAEMQKINEQLRDAYLDCQDAQRFQTNVEGKAVVITSSAQLAQKVEQITNHVYN